VLGHFGCKGPGWEQAAAFFDEVHFEIDVLSTPQAEGESR